MEIAETYPDDYVLVKVVEINHNKGVQSGIALYAGSSYDDLFVLICTLLYRY